MRMRETGREEALAVGESPPRDSPTVCVCADDIWCYEALFLSPHLDVLILKVATQLSQTQVLWKRLPQSPGGAVIDRSLAGVSGREWIISLAALESITEWRSSRAPLPPP